ncbi:hypothetical protein OSB04_010513 [Centaurea solstitialis]|uniref:Uncharacterized protein n=1 Tax=Centaurea solstitialis TaxID=347529 RepID=A0AA38T7R0_9ASTR|nr:hypothetical protein OSB04_010513 [Centaurea solstitialis]
MEFRQKTYYLPAKNPVTSLYSRSLPGCFPKESSSAAPTIQDSEAYRLLGLKLPEEHYCLHQELEEIRVRKVQSGSDRETDSRLTLTLSNPEKTPVRVGVRPRANCCSCPSSLNSVELGDVSGSATFDPGPRAAIGTAIPRIELRERNVIDGGGIGIGMEDGGEGGFELEDRKKVVVKVLYRGIGALGVTQSPPPPPPSSNHHSPFLLRILKPISSPEFLSNEDILMEFLLEKEKPTNNNNKGSSTEFYGFGLDLSSPVESVMGSIETESNEKDYLTELTPIKQCILDDFEFYEERQKRIQEKKAKQQQFQKQAWEEKATIVVEKKKDEVNVAENGEVAEKKIVANGVANEVLRGGRWGRIFLATGEKTSVGDGATFSISRKCHFQDLVVIVDYRKFRGYSASNPKSSSSKPKKQFISNLTSLQILDLSGNNLIGSIPSEIGSLERMIRTPKIIAFIDVFTFLVELSNLILNWKR